MTGAARTGTTAVPKYLGSPELEIGAMTIRGHGVSPATGRTLAAAVAEVLAGQLAGRSARVGGMTIRMPASVLDANSGIDRAVVAQAIARGKRDSDA